MEYAYSNQTLLHPASLVLLLFLIIVTLSSSKDNVLIPFLIIACVVPAGQRIVIAGLDFTFIRILTVFGWLRILIRNEIRSIKLERIDNLVLLYFFFSVLSYTIQRKSFGGFLNALGTSLDSIGAYFLFRFLFQSRESIRKILRTILYISIPTSIIFLLESRSGFNLFSLLGGVGPFSIIREGRVRAQGPYPHPIIAGSLWASQIPVIIGTYRMKGMGSKPLKFIAIVCSFSVVYLCASSTPMMSTILGIGTLLLYTLRRDIARLRHGFLFGLIILQIYMENPIWFLYTKIDVAGGSTGYFRFLLFDMFIRNWKDWILVGVIDTYHWGAHLNLPSIGLADITNQFVLEAVRGGLSSLVVFILIILETFNELKRIYSGSSKAETFFVWSLGASLVVHLFNFLGVSYFGQITLIWWLLLAMIASYREIVDSEVTE